MPGFPKSIMPCAVKSISFFIAIHFKLKNTSSSYFILAFLLFLLFVSCVSNPNWEGVTIVTQPVNLVLVLCPARKRFTRLWRRWPLFFLRSVNVFFLPLIYSVKQAWVSDLSVYGLSPQRPALDAVRASLKLLASSASRLQVECRKAAPSDPSASTVDYQLLTQQVIQCAYDIAKAAKQLVTITTREKKQWPVNALDGCWGHTTENGTHWWWSRELQNSGLMKMRKKWMVEQERHEWFGCWV